MSANPIYILFRRLRSPLILLILAYSVAILGFVLIPGVDDQGQVYRMSFFDAFYFVSFMATTIGFGEIPYEFTKAQRFWALFSMYATVISWLYGIGVLLSVFQDKVFLNQIKKSNFARKVRNIREDFYIICGYGDTGVQLTHLLAEDGILSVIIDSEAARIQDLETDDFRVTPLSICDDASQSEVLELAGIQHPSCKGIITIANDDTVNLMVAIVTHLLNPKLRLIARAETPEAEANILSFGANEVINPFETFASRLSLALQSPSLYCLYDWMTGVSGGKMNEPPSLDYGRWIICNFGRFGRELYEHLDKINVDLCVIESNRSAHPDLPSGSVIGRATEASTLKKAGIKEAVGIIAGTNNDANNLSIILTATELNPDLFRVVRQNRDKNSHLFKAADYEMLMQRGNIISNTIFAFIRTPMLGDFLRIVSRFKNERASELVSQIIGIAENNETRLWEFKINELEGPALFQKIQKEQVTIGDLIQEKITIEDVSSLDNDEVSFKRISAMPLFMKRDENNILLPEDNRVVRAGDRILMCGTENAQEHIQLLLNDKHFLNDTLHGKVTPNSTFWRWLKGK